MLASKGFEPIRSVVRSQRGMARRGWAAPLLRRDELEVAESKRPHRDRCTNAPGHCAGRARVEGESDAHAMGIAEGDRPLCVCKMAGRTLAPPWRLLSKKGSTSVLATTPPGMTTRDSPSSATTFSTHAFHLIRVDRTL